MTTSQQAFTLHTTIKRFEEWLESYLQFNDKSTLISVQLLHWEGERIIQFFIKSGKHVQMPTRLEGHEKFSISLDDVTCNNGNGYEPLVNLPDALRTIQELLAAVPNEWLQLPCPYDFTKIVQDEKLAHILSSRWEESTRTFKAEAYLSTIIMLGSILEGVLLDKVKQHPKIAGNAKSAPIERGKVKNFDDWYLNDLIVVAQECNWISKDRRNFSLVLRDYRNFVHPRQQLKHQEHPNVGTCNIIREVVAATLDDLSKLLPTY